MLSELSTSTNKCESTSSCCVITRTASSSISTTPPSTSARKLASNSRCPRCRDRPSYRYSHQMPASPRPQPQSEHGPGPLGHGLKFHAPAAAGKGFRRRVHAQEPLEELGHMLAVPASPLSAGPGGEAGFDHEHDQHARGQRSPNLATSHGNRAVATGGAADDFRRQSAE